MNIRIAGDLIKAARREAFEEAAKIVDRESNRIMRLAHGRHDAENPDYDRYEELECKAAILCGIAGRIRRRGKRS